jgi:hypothetical protein
MGKPLMRNNVFSALSQGPPALLHVVVQKVEEAAMDEMWSFVGQKGQ